MINDRKLDLPIRDVLCNLPHLARAKQRGRPWRRQRHDDGLAHIEIDGLGKSTGLGKPVIEAVREPVARAVTRMCAAAQIRHDDKRARRRTASHEAIAIDARLLMLV
jgi:hypothetical protein